MRPGATTHLASVPESAAEARRFVRDLLTSWDCADPDDVALLLTSEVVSNAIRHAASEEGIDLVVDVAGDVLRVEVHDTGDGEPVMGEPEVGAVGGRGLLLLDALARRWGAVRKAGGKVVWFELPAEPRRQAW